MFFIVYTFYILLIYGSTIISRKKRIEHRSKRSEMNSLREKDNLTLEEQKKFVNLKYPKRQHKKITMRRVVLFITRLVIILGILIGLKTLWAEYITYNLKLWYVILYAIIMPMILNKILKKFGLERDDVSVFF